MKKISFLLIASLYIFNAPAFSETVPTPETPAVPDTPKTLVVADFETGELKNLLDGDSGGWNLDPMDENNSYTDVDIIQMPGIKGDMNNVVKLTYSVESEVRSQNGFWTKLMGFDATNFDHLEFEVKGDAEKGFTEKFLIEIKKYKDDKKIEKIKANHEVSVTSEWTTVSIPLNKLTGIINFYDSKAWENPAIARKDLDEFVVVFVDRHVTQKKGVIYIDNIRFVKTGNPGPTAVDFPPRSREKTEVKMEGLDFARFLIKRLGGFPEQVVVKKEFSQDDREFLMEIARDTWRFFNEITDQEHGLPLDTIQLGEKEVLEEGAWVGDYTNVTNIGVYLMCLVSAYDLGLISQDEAIAKIQLTLNTIEKLEFHSSGFPYNYYDTTTLDRTSYFVSLVDSGWLVAGLYVVKNAFPEQLGVQADRMIHRGNLIFFYDTVEQQMFHGYYQHLEEYSDYHYGAFYTEPRATSYIAIARGEVPEEHWFGGLIRTFPEDYTWQTQPPIQRIKKTVRGHEFDDGYYEWKGIKFIPSWGGSAFEALMPTLIIQEKELAPKGLGLNNLSHVLGQIRYAKDELGYPVWGMSPSSVPEGGYSEYGAQPFGSKGYKSGVVTPHASVLSLEYAPQEAISNLRKLIELYDIYGEYGFYDAVTVATGKVAHKYLALDQGMIFVAINNYLNGGAIRKRFHTDPEMKKGEFLLTDEIFFEQPKPEAAAEPSTVVSE